MGGKAEKFSKGEPVELKFNDNGKPKIFKFSSLYRFRAKYLVPLIMIFFIVTYLVIIISLFYKFDLINFFCCFFDNKC